MVFWHKRHKRVFMEVDGLSVLERGWNGLKKQKRIFFTTKDTKGCGWKLMGCRFLNTDETDWSDKNGFFYHKRHKRVLVKVDGLSLLEHIFEKFDKFKKKLSQKAQKGLGSWWVVAFGTRMKRIERIKTDFLYGKCVLGFWNTGLKNLRNLKKNYHKRHKRELEVYGLSLLEHGF